MKKEITFIYMDRAEEQSFLPLYNEAVSRGYSAKMTQNKFEKCEIGFYCQHNNFPQFSKFSVIMLHDIIQGYGRWPDIWFLEPWDKYDIGILPGKQWGEMWEYSSQYFYARTKRGVYQVGWPKSDVVKDLNVEEIKKEIAKRYKYNSGKQTILYAPSWENDGKQDDFVKAMLKLDVNVLVKQSAADPTIFPELAHNIKEMELLHKNNERVIILDPKTNIIDAISISDVLVSEESSTMCEAVMLGIPAISVSNWFIPDVTPSRYPKDDYSFVIKTKKENLTECVEEVLMNYDYYKSLAQNYSSNNFANIGNTSTMIMDIVDSYVGENNVPIDVLVPHSSRVKLGLTNFLKHWILRLKSQIVCNYSVRYKAVGSMYEFYKSLKTKV